MVNVRTSGFDSPAQLREYLAEVEEDGDMVEAPERDASRGNIHRDLAALRKDVAALRRQIDAMHRHSPRAGRPREDHSWLRIALTIAATALLGNLVQRLRLGTAGAAAMPMIVAKADRRLW
ncbi:MULTISPECIES: hypothetical protein [unclassified Shinella]|uniref:hypothetical protein n=2 Tax=Shinella TaxID=323620 RepID=UPI00225CBB47|nr:hypothetical protein [Shinella sp. YE25]MDC7258178.1 hypothetical protein [Shinella sp. YE25]CAI0335063.1 conserved hypothetical protein [Rhizobiaceae bacterium]CAK7259378.1 conserved protein of unknown function [Shinella sp. WSC3-e]